MSSSEAEKVVNVFGFGAFRGALDVGPEEKMQRDEILAKWKLETLTKHIGGFKYWPDLIDDCKEVVVKFLDYETLTNLGMCSKFDNELVKKIPIDVYSITIEDFENHDPLRTDAVENALVRVLFDKDPKSENGLEMTSTQMDNDTQIRCVKYSNNKQPKLSSLVVENSNYYEEAVKYAEQWMERCQFKMEEITVGMSKYPFETSKIKFLPNCTRVKIRSDSVQVFRWWIDRVPEKLDYLEFDTRYERRETFTLPTEFLSLPQITEAKDLYFRARAGFTDEQFIKLKAKKIKIDAENITDDGVNQFLRKWINGEGTDGFEAASLRSTRAVNQKLVMWAPCRFATCRFATLPLRNFCQFRNLPFRNLPLRNSAASQLCRFATCRFATLPFRNSAISQLCHFATLPFRNCAVSQLLFFEPAD